MKSSQRVPESDWAFGKGRHLWMPYCQMKSAAPPLSVAGTVGDEIVLEGDVRLVDSIASWWTACHGYGHPALINAVVNQSRTMAHVMFAGLYHDQADKLSTRLANLLPGDLNRTFLCDTGSVAVEVALKMAVQYWINRQQSGRTKFVCFRNGYHGDTTGAMSICDPNKGMHAHFKGFLLEQFPQAIPDDPEELIVFESFLGTHSREIAGVIIEPLAQMAAGVRFHSTEALAGIYKICDDHGVLFIADEIATGFGRTGTMFAIEQADICPDIVCLGKGLTGGMMTLAATVVRDHVYEAFHSDDPKAALMHGPTFMGNPLACAAANASLDLFESEDRMEQVAELSHIFSEAAVEIDWLPDVISARSLGAILAVEFAAELDRDAVTAWFVERGIWSRPIRNVVYACPPFTISRPNLDRVVEAIRLFSETGYASLS